jgi:hypothetical protein
MKRSINAAHIRRSFIVGAVVCASAFALSCSPAGDTSNVSGGPDGAGTTATSGGTGSTQAGTGGKGITLPGDLPKGNDDGPCMGLECSVPSCAAGADTTISGKVYDPAGKTPLYNVVVYVPNGPVPAFTEGAACDRCGSSISNPVTAAVTDETGSFKLQKAPAGPNIPLVIQVGKWRRQITIPNVASCADTPLTDPQVTRLPRNKAEGDLPRIAITVGAADQMECLPLRMGIDPAEFTTAAGDGRIHLYLGHHNEPGGGPGGGMGAQPVLKFDDAHNAGAALTSADALWASADSLMKYDITILSCEGGAFEREKPMGVREAMYQYESQGGRVFASHWHNIWFEQGPDPLPTTGTWNTRRVNPSGTDDNPNGDDRPLPATINQTFPKGEALAKWLVNVNASTTLGNMDVVYPRDNIQAVNPALASEWISVDNPNYPEAPKAVQYMSFNTPIGVPEEQICGRAVYTNLHVAAVDNNNTLNALGFPASCEPRDLSAQEKAVAFMLFDLSSCVQNDRDPPQVPK